MSHTYAEIAVNAAVYQTFHYHIPEALADTLDVGHLVRVAFGTGMQPGIVLALHDESPVDQTKPVLERYDPVPVVTPMQIDMARWLSEQYIAPIGPCLWLWLPPGIVGKHDRRVSLLMASAQGDDNVQAAVIDALKRRGSLTGEQLKRAVGNRWERAVQKLEKAGAVQTEPVLLPPRVKPRKIQVAELAIAPSHIPHVVRSLGKSSRPANALLRLLRMKEEGQWPLTVEDVLALPGLGDATVNALLEAGALKVQDGRDVDLADDADSILFAMRDGEHDRHILRILAREDGPTDVSWVYAQAGANLDDLKRLEARGLIHLGEKETYRDPLADHDFVPVTPPPLMSGQRHAWAPIRETIEARAAGKSSTPTTYLLHGVTGSGKTEVYLRAIERTVALGRQAIFLVPEIALTPQTIHRVMARFPGRVAIVHSALSEGERYDTWRRARDGDYDVVVGTRSALFTPLPDLGLVVLDEEHDHSYKQAPPTGQPYYHARAAAEQLMYLNNGVVILGSATPALETTYRAERGEIVRLHLPDRIMGHRVRVTEQAERRGVRPRYEPVPQDGAESLTIGLPDVQVVDMREELKAGHADMFSRPLLDALETVLSRGEQALLFLNRRGTATYVFCRDCGYVATCPRCNTPLTYHHYSGQMYCHHCNYNADPPARCPNCDSTRIKYFGAGTQHVEAAFSQHFPKAVALRWDSDTAAKGGHDHILHRFMAGQADVLIGTQMIAKGLDLPLVTLVGVVSADVGLNLPDFRASERTFQLLTQVAGRAGRGLLGGRVVLQTYQPEHRAIQAAAEHDYARFYADEIIARREIGYPPFRRLVRILLTDHDGRRAQSEAERAANILGERLDSAHEAGDTELIGPVPCFFQRLNRLYRWQVILRGAAPTRLLDDLVISRTWHIDVDPVDLL